MSFYVKDNFLYCERLKVKDIQKRVSASPFYLYSLDRITNNYNAYVKAIGDRSAIVAYAFKANGNLSLLKHLNSLGSGAVLVSENELKLAAAAGFDPKRTIFNGNGKTETELMLAAEQGVMINIDSEFDLHHIEGVAGKAGKIVDVLIRVNPDIDPEVHPYVSTGIRHSKFGIREDRVPWFLDRIRAASALRLVGVHCHLGSTINDISVFGEAARRMMKYAGLLRREGFEPRFINIGGGLGIAYDRGTTAPGPKELWEALSDCVAENITLIIEPGRSIVADAGVLVARVIGVKTNDDKRFVVVDASMTELIRPSLYGAYHHIDFIEPVGGEAKLFDIVGPVCESADFLGKDRQLATPHEGAGVAVFDTGAYGFAMSSNYNARLRPPEYLVDGDRLTEIRRAETFEDHMRFFDSHQPAKGS